MKKIILLATWLLLITDIVMAQPLSNNNVPAPLCDECSRFPFKPIGCDHINCLAQMLSTISRQELISVFFLPANIADKIIQARNINGRMGVEEYQAVLDPEEYHTLLRTYDNYVTANSPVQPKVEQQVRDFAPPIYFAVNKTAIGEPYYKTLREAAIALQADPGLMLTITGSTDNTGKEAANKRLALARANAVKKYLVEHHIAANRITVTARKKDNPFAPNNTPEGRAKNRNAVMETSR